MRGTPYYYYGDELGMSNIRFTKIEDYRDIETINKYKRTQQDKGDLKKLIEEQKIRSRDNGRTPFQWDASVHAGFSNAEPWLKVNPNYTTINQQAEEKDPNSILNYFRKIVKLRKENPVLVYGKYTLLDKKNPDIYAYTRELNGKQFLVLLNFRNKPAIVTTDEDLGKAKLLLGNYQNPSKGKLLQAYESVVYELQ
jgi:oligo-1,6-glucosidase